MKICFCLSKKWTKVNYFECVKFLCRKYNDILVFCSTDNIEVRFYEQNDKGEKVWEAKGKDVYVHYQYAIALKTPSYQDVNIKQNVSNILDMIESVYSIFTSKYLCLIG